ncbi:hypothetical protein MRB53_038762 [Persea americana]|nr:hypothetical protein MRB53_038762 [Persea americana]
MSTLLVLLLNTYSRKSTIDVRMRVRTADVLVRNDSIGAYWLYLSRWRRRSGMTSDNLGCPFTSFWFFHKQVAIHRSPPVLMSSLQSHVGNDVGSSNTLPEQEKHFLNVVIALSLKNSIVMPCDCSGIIRNRVSISYSRDFNVAFISFGDAINVKARPTEDSFAIELPFGFRLSIDN